MPKNKILVVDDETDVAKMVCARLNKAGYDAASAGNGPIALEYVKKTLPDLIILDIMMPGMNGYEVAEHLHKNPKAALIPIIMLTAKTSTADKVKALQMGIDDYITKPYDADELVARIEAVLRRSKKQPPEAVLNETDQQRINFLRAMIKDKVSELIPEYNMASLNGYAYPYAAGFFETHDGSELGHLTFVAEKGCLEQRFFDKIMTCPYCRHHDINVRETCPSNHSADISIVEMIHHFRCGYVGTEDEFKQGLHYVCPKCNEEARQIGIDYDKPGQSYICNETGEKFTDPEIYCQCRNCKKIFEGNDALWQVIFAYILTERGKEIAKNGRFTELNLEQVLIDKEVDLYNLRYFRKCLDDEMARAEKFKRPFSLVLVDIRNFDKLIGTRGSAKGSRILSDIASILKTDLWAVNTPARYDKNAFIVLLPETEKKGAEKMANLVQEKIKAMKEGSLDIYTTVVSYPEDSETKDGLLELLVKAQGQGEALK
ncbi:MAG: response regulator [Candidatus Omnitrophota bacterium]